MVEGAAAVEDDQDADGGVDPDQDEDGDEEEGDEDGDEEGEEEEEEDAHAEAPHVDHAAESKIEVAAGNIPPMELV